MAQGTEWDIFIDSNNLSFGIIYLIQIVFYLIGGLKIDTQLDIITLRLFFRSIID